MSAIVARFRSVVPSRSARRAIVVACALATLLRPATIANARARGPTTGLPAIAYAKPPPDFTFDGTRGPTRLRLLAGRPVVVNFWATWCEPCREELGAFAALGPRYGRAVDLIMISDEAPGVAAAFLRGHGIDGATVVDDPARKIFDLYTVTPIPTTLVVEPGGTVSYVSVGEISWTELRTAIDVTRPLGTLGGGRSPLTPEAASDRVGVNAGTPAP